MDEWKPLPPPSPPPRAPMGPFADSPVSTAEGTHGMRCEHPSGITPRMKLCRQECARFHTWMKLLRSKNAASCVPSESKDNAAMQGLARDL